MRSNGGILYVGATFDTGIRAGRIRMARSRRLSMQDLLEIQADVVTGDARFFTPHIVRALVNAQRTDAPAALQALAHDARVQEAVGRLAAWDQCSPTGLAEGYDASDLDGRRATPSALEIANSVATTIYSAWSSQMILQTLVGTLGPLDGGAAPRFIARGPPLGCEAVTSLPGGQSGAIDSPFHANLLPRWLTNDTVALRQDLVDLLSHAHDVTVFVPAREIASQK